MRYRRYRTASSTTLRAFVAVLSKPGLAWLCADMLAAMEHELLMRDIEAIADESGGYLVVAPGGWN